MTLPSVDIAAGDAWRGSRVAFPGDDPAEGALEGVVDCSVHVRPAEVSDLREYIAPAWRERRLPDVNRYYFPNPVGDDCSDTWPEQGPPGSDPALAARQLFEVAGVADAVLLPLTFGLLPDADLAAAICSALNDWQAERWLSRRDDGGRWWGSIRVSPDDPAQAVREIERWAEHPRFVQIALPAQTLEPYGRRRYLPVWEAAAAAGLPVAIHADAASGTEPALTPSGLPSHFVEYSSYLSLNFAYHFMSLVAEGVFARFRDLVVTFADGGHDFLAPLMWRWDKDYRPTRHEMPWLAETPVDHQRNVRFVTQAMEGPPEAISIVDEWLTMSDARDVLVFGSNYPHWDFLDPRRCLAGADADIRRSVLVDGPRSLYRLDERAPNDSEEASQ